MDTQLLAACKEGRADECRTLLLAGASVGAIASDGRTPLHVASEAGSTECVKALIFAKADLTHASGASPLFVAAQSGKFECVELLADEGADIDQVAKKSGKTPLFAASEAGHSDVVGLLLRRQASPDVMAGDGATPLIAASSAGHFDVVRALLDADASILPADGGGTALDHAAGHAAVIALLQQAERSAQALVPAFDFSDESEEEDCPTAPARGARTATQTGRAGAKTGKGKGAPAKGAPAKGAPAADASEPWRSTLRPKAELLSPEAKARNQQRVDAMLSRLDLVDGDARFAAEAAERARERAVELTRGQPKRSAAGRRAAEKAKADSARRICERQRALGLDGGSTSGDEDDS